MKFMFPLIVLTEVKDADTLLSVTLPDVVLTLREELRLLSLRVIFPLTVLISTDSDAFAIRTLPDVELISTEPLRLLSPVFMAPLTVLMLTFPKL